MRLAKCDTLAVEGKGDSYEYSMYWVRLKGFYVVERFSANFSENCSEAGSGRPWGSRGKFKTVQAFYSNSVLQANDRCL